MGIRASALTIALLGCLAVGQGTAVGRDLNPGARQAPVSEDPARRAVIDDFYDTWLRNQKVAVGWTGSVSDCDPGQASDAATKATISQINYFRNLAGLRGVGLDGELTRVAQKTALIMDANDQLSHDPPVSWRCHTTAGSNLAGRSNLALGSEGTGARAVTRYMVDSAHTSVAHRRWLLSPRTAQMATGSTGDANAIVVVGMPQHDLAVPSWIPWPPAGYFPQPLEPNGNWSLSTTLSKVDFSGARITVTDDAGHSYDVKRFPVQSAYAAPTLVWRVKGLRTPTLAKDIRYDVRVVGLQRSGSRMSGLNWTVTMVKPDRPTNLVELPVVRGTYEVGRELAVSQGNWSPIPVSFSYQWLRDGEPISGATNPFYLVGSADRGKVVSVRVGAHALFFAVGKIEVGGVRIPTN